MRWTWGNDWNYWSWCSATLGFPEAKAKGRPVHMVLNRHDLFLARALGHSDLCPEPQRPPPEWLHAPPPSQPCAVEGASPAPTLGWPSQSPAVCMCGLRVHVQLCSAAKTRQTCWLCHVDDGPARYLRWLEHRPHAPGLWVRSPVMAHTRINRERRHKRNSTSVSLSLKPVNKNMATNTEAGRGSGGSGSQ